MFKLDLYLFNKCFLNYIFEKHFSQNDSIKIIYFMVKFYLFKTDKLIEKEGNEDCVYMHSESLRKLGIETFVEESKRPILKISYNGIKIYRKYSQGSNFGITLNHLSLSRRDERILGLNNLKEEKCIIEIDISKSNLIGKFKYYYHNPKNDIRLAARLAIWGTLIGLTTSILGSFIYELLKFYYFKS